LSPYDLYFRAANFLTAAQLYLRDNVLLERPLVASDFKSRVVGHWGTNPGISFVNAHLSRLVRDRGCPLMTVVGPGHGAAGVLANLFLEGTLEELYPTLRHTRDGIQDFVRRFGAAGGFPTEHSPAMPDCVHFGGELGHALSVSFGLIADNPELIVACLVGDGEAETGPTAAAWQGPKYFDARHSGAVLPILHLNGVKLTSSTLSALMPEQELIAYFRALRYEPTVVGPEHAQMSAAVDEAYTLIRRNQASARSDARGEFLRWPLIIMRTPKGWTGPRTYGGADIEGTRRSHKAPIPAPAQSPDAIAAVEAWLRGYGPRELFDEDGGLRPEVLRVLPPQPLRLGRTAARIFQSRFRPLELPDPAALTPEPAANGTRAGKSMAAVAIYLRDMLRLNARTRSFRLFSPDELDSNGLGGLLAETGRSFASPPPHAEGGLSADGLILEVLSEHLCQAWMQGYVAGGGHGLFVTYECFAPIVASMLTQSAKLLGELQDRGAREPPASLNLLLTSLGWTNNFSHQNPDLYGSVLALRDSVAHVLFPPDAASTLACLHRCLQSRGRINVISASKTDLPQWLDAAEAARLAEAGVGVIGALGEVARPDLVFAAVGDFATREAVAAMLLLRQAAPELRSRFVSVCDPAVLGSPERFSRGLSDARFHELFGADAPVLMAVNGFALPVKGLLLDRPRAADRFRVTGYLGVESAHGDLGLLMANETSRYELVLHALKGLGRTSGLPAERLERLQEEARAAQAAVRAEVAATSRAPFALNDVHAQPSLAELARRR
jgi:xylulose-5-phosphate/fructose-6-phosphate phosphoketolase